MIKLVSFQKYILTEFFFFLQIALTECVAVKSGDYIGLYAPVTPWSVGLYGSYSILWHYNGFHDLYRNNKIPEVGDKRTLDQASLPHQLSFVAHIAYGE